MLRSEMVPSKIPPNGDRTLLSTGSGDPAEARPEDPTQTLPPTSGEAPVAGHPRRTREVGLESGRPNIGEADRFVERSLLGVGGMNRVVRAFDRDVRRDVAIKVLLPELSEIS